MDSKRRLSTSAISADVSGKKTRPSLPDASDALLLAGSSTTNNSDANVKDAKDKDAENPTTGGSPSILLRDLLDFINLTAGGVQVDDIRKRFAAIATALLHGHRLVLRRASAVKDEGEGEGERYDVLEVEFYLWIDGVHEDPYTHGSEEQRVAGRWYFHRAPRRSNDSSRSKTSASGYRGGTRKGLDLTIGKLGTTTTTTTATTTSPYFSSSTSSSTTTTTTTAGASSSSNVQREGPERDVRGGILLRSLRRVSDGKVISGPSVLVDEVLRASGAGGIKELVEDIWGGDTNAFQVSPSAGNKGKASLRVEAIQDSEKEEGGHGYIYSSPRIGLDLSHPGTSASPTHPRVAFVDAPYRFFVRPDLLTANGRPQTFLGVFSRLCADKGDGFSLSLREADEEALDEFAKTSGIGRGAVVRYYADYRHGREKGKVSTYVKVKTSSPSEYLRMVGAVTSARSRK
ncbi:hypothetical protein BD410DRAFT_710865 [Rickenella mellea]|uniref:Uncharacterized protein n=1 Tax=Rickenella mellea TaxID=50990 RepID=A0A4R5XFZ7_9AGAM|nr:hypothetical protein BD410DRAFT_710865 [Rickenella mellea]